MTQPVQEPNPNRDLSGLGWGERQLARRPAPAAGGAGTEWCIVESWDYTDDNTVPDSTWTLVAGGTQPDGFMQDAYQSAGFDGSFSFASGSITVANKKFYWGTAWVQYWGTFNEGDIVAVALNRGSSDRRINSIVCGAAGVLGDLKIAVTAELTVGNFTWWIETWHNNGAAMSLRDARLEIVEFGPLDDALWQSGP